MTHYVLGFVFSLDLSKVWLIRKRRPAWQAGKLNGIGGHIEPMESCVGAMRRECREETGVEIPTWAWSHFATMTFKDSLVFCFRALSDDPPQTKTDEEVIVVPPRELPPGVITNLHWLVPMAMNIPVGESVVNLVDGSPLMW